MDNTKQYCVTVKLYTWAHNKEEAVKQVTQDLGYLAYSGNCGTAISGYSKPLPADAVEDKEV